MKSRKHSQKGSFRIEKNDCINLIAIILDFYSSNPTIYSFRYPFRLKVEGSCQEDLQGQIVESMQLY